MALRIAAFDVDVAVRRSRPGNAAVMPLGERLMARYAGPAAIGVNGGNGAPIPILEPGWEAPASRNLVAPSVSVVPTQGARAGDHGSAGWFDGGATAAQDVAEVEPVPPKAPGPERYVTDAVPRFIAPPLQTPEPTPFARALPIAARPAAGATRFQPLFKLMEKSPARARESESAKAARIRAESGAGRALEAATRRQMEDFFGADLGDVRVHADDKAGAAARAQGAEAFTIGKDIYFGDAKFDPASRKGKGLLAHELTHVLQQNGMARRKVQGFTQGRTTDGLEAEAEAMRASFLSRRDDARIEDFSVERYLCDYRANRPPTASERARLERIAAMALRMCGEILQAEQPALLRSVEVVDDLQVDLDLSLAQLSDEEAAKVWARRLVSAIALRQAAEAPAASLIVQPAVLRQASPPSAASGASTKHDLLKAEANADALQIRKLLTQISSPIAWFTRNEPAIMKIVEKWAEKPLERVGLQMTPFDFLIVALQGQTFKVEEWFVEQWTNAFDQMFERMSPKRLGRFKALMQSHGGAFKDDKPIGMVHFEVGKVLKEAGEVYLEVGAAFFTGGSSLIAKIGAWCVTTLPKLYDQAKAVVALVDRIRGIDLDDVKRLVSPRGLGDLLVNALFGKADGLPAATEAGKDKAEDQRQPESRPEASGLVSLLRRVMALIGALKSGYNKAAEGVNAILARLDITKMQWFEPFSMAYAGVVRAAEMARNPAATLRQGAQALRGLVGGFFQTIREKVAAIAESVKDHLDFVGKGRKLIADLADKAVEMVLNFIVTHPPSALVKTALRVLEAAADRPIIKVLRDNVPYADDIIKKISESDTVKGLLQPLEAPAAALGDMTTTVAGEATKVVTGLETQALSLVDDGATMVGELSGVPVTQPAAPARAAAAPARPAPPAAKAGKGVGAFLGAVKHGLHTHLLELGTQALLRHGKRLGKAAVDKGVSAAKTLGGKVKGLLLAKVDFWVRGKPHELWTEERDGEIDVYVASEEKTLREKIEGYRAAFGTEEAKRIERLEELLTKARAWKEKEKRDPRYVGGRLMPLNREMARIVAKLDERLTGLFSRPDERIFRNAERDITVVLTPAGPRAFYKRTGGGGADVGWAAKGNWVPFSGFLKYTYRKQQGGEWVTREAEWFIKPRTGRMGQADDAATSTYLGNTLGRGDIRLGTEVTDIKLLNDWLRSHGVEVGGGYEVGDRLQFKKKVGSVVEIP